LQDDGGGHFVDHLLALGARHVGGQQDFFGLDGAEAFVNKLDRQSQSGVQPVGKNPRALGGRAFLAFWIYGQAKHNAIGARFFGRSADGVEIAHPTVSRDGCPRLGSESQSIRYRNADASRAQVDAEHSGHDQRNLVYYRTWGTTSNMSDEPKPPANAPQLQIELDEVTAQGAYSNLVFLNHNDAEFTLDFVYVQPGGPRARVRSRIIMSPRHAKRFLRALENNISRYEQVFGKIDEGHPVDPMTVS
jgi:hypothetical protein